MTNRSSTAPLLETPADPGVREVALVPAEGANLVLMFERLAKDPAVDPDKLEKLIDLQERIIRHNAEAAFWEAFSQMQGELPTINEDGSISVNGVVRSRYSTNENIQEVIRPILHRHRFALSFRNATKENGTVVVTGILAGYGHKETDSFESAPDSGGSMNSIQRIGSTRSYGQRYTTIALLNIVSRAPQDRDDDGRRTGKPDAPDPPQGYEDWLKGLHTAATKGLKTFEPAWECSDGAFKSYAMKWHRDGVNQLKKQAAEVGKGAR